MTKYQHYAMTCRHCLALVLMAVIWIVVSVVPEAKAEVDGGLAAPPPIEVKAAADIGADAARLQKVQEADTRTGEQAVAETKPAAKAARIKTKPKTKPKPKPQKQAAAEAQQEVEAEVARVKAEQEVQAAEREAARLKAEQEAKVQAEKQAAAEARQAAEAEAARVKAEQQAQADAKAAAAAKAARLKTQKGMLEDVSENVARLKAEQKAKAEAQAAADAKAAKQKAARSDMLVDFVQRAVLQNPDVLTRWHTFQAAVSETTAAQGGYFPRLDLTVNSGRERGQSSIDNYGVNTKNITFTLTQMLYDGFATRNEVRRLNNVQLARYYELLDASETAALEAARTFYDMSRQRKLFELTEDNYVRHRTAFEQIKLKVEAGVGRRVDLEQAAGRLALSESNLTLDNANVHDVSARFQRVIGLLPPAKMRKSPSQAKLSKQILPNAAAAVLSVAADYHPAVLAAVENVRSARYDMYGRRSAFQPTVNLSIAQTHSKNLGGVDGLTGNASAQVTLNWNLFSGGSDKARSSQYAKNLDAAYDLRDKACRDIHLILAIAYNDIYKLNEQLKFLDQHQLSIEKARTAYQKQFDIGQRSLLDLLDTENELYQSKRAYVNAEYDLAIAEVRTLAGMGRLVNALGISHLETADLPELLGTGSDASENCPREAPLANNINKEELDARAIEEAKAAIEAARLKAEESKAKQEAEDKAFLATPGEATAAEQETGKGINTPDTSPNAGQGNKVVEPPQQKTEAEAQAAKMPAGTPEILVERWVTNWADKDVDSYLSRYDIKFRPADGKDRAVWEALRRKQIGGAASIKLKAKNLRIEPQGELLATARFVEVIEIGNYVNALRKKLVMVRRDGTWKILDEREETKLEIEAEAARVKAEQAEQASKIPVSTPELLVERWMNNWAGKDVDGYLSHYDIGFRPENGKDRKAWEAMRRSRITSASSIKVQAKNLRIEPQGELMATARFVETIEVGKYVNASRKKLLLVRRDGEWKILEEKEETESEIAAAAASLKAGQASVQPAQMTVAPEAQAPVAEAKPKTDVKIEASPVKSEPTSVPSTQLKAESKAMAAVAEKAKPEEAKVEAAPVKTEPAAAESVQLNAGQEAQAA
ncbi:MAG: TolC family outer membrane protein, partial [Gallionella sp.]|nr:TolC family outer membrane protein [Gallionella sp.]